MATLDLTVVPFEEIRKKKLNPALIKQVYYGTLNCCRCGCGGEYYEPGHEMVQKGLDVLKQRANGWHGDYIKYDEFNDELYFEVQTGTDTLDDPDYDGLTYADNEEREIGWAFYLYKTLKDKHAATKNKPSNDGQK